MTQGLQQAGVAATAKHFPGHGDTASDSHHGLVVVPHSRERLDQVELPPFAAAIAAGAKLVMAAHVALPALTEGVALPATLAPQVLRGLLRGALGFRPDRATVDKGAMARGSGR
jgi:beta-N-acetylhexosaminidase